MNDRMTDTEALEILRTVTNRALKGSPTRMAFDHIASRIVSSYPAENFALVPLQMRLSRESVAALVFHLGGDEESQDHDERWMEGVLWVGEAGGDEGGKAYGLHVSNADYPEEGCVTLVEFPPPTAALTDQGRAGEES